MALIRNDWVSVDRVLRMIWMTCGACGNMIPGGHGDAPLSMFDGGFIA
jgi:hypothetical protein